MAKFLTFTLSLSGNFFKIFIRQKRLFFFVKIGLLITYKALTICEKYC